MPSFIASFLLVGKQSTAWPESSVLRRFFDLAKPCLRDCAFAGLLLSLANSGLAETIVEGTVRLPPARLTSAPSSRYQQKAGNVGQPQPPVAVVYLEGSFAAPRAQSQITNKVEQKDYQFVPGILPVFRGSEVKFPNLDQDYHHVFSYSKPKKFDLGRYRNDEDPPAAVFDKPGVVKVGCEIHDHMRAVILVLDTPYFTATAPDGKYRLVLNEVPDGKYALKAWVSEKIVWERPIEVKKDTKLTVDFLGQ